MKNLTKDLINIKKLKYIVIVVFGSILDIFLHAITPSNSNIPNETTGSSLTKSLGFVGAAVLYFLITFGILAYIFYMYEDKLSGTKVVKGLKYGVAIGILWWCGMLEGVTLWGTTPLHEFLMGAGDSIPIIVTGLLLGKFTAKTNSDEKNRRKNFFIPLIMFSIIFLAGRYFLYCTNIIKSGYSTTPYFTFFWTLFMGTTIGITYLLLGKVTQSSSTLISAIKFGVIVFGFNWFMYTIYMPFVFNISSVDAILRSAGDCLWVTLSYYFSVVLEKSIVKINKIRNTK